MELTLQAPFPWFLFGGKRLAAPLIWAALGDPAGFVEPFCGSAAVLLARPGTDRPGWRRVETLNDADGWLVNAWRAIRADPEAVAGHCVGPVTEIDYHARLAWLQERRGDGLVAWLEGDPEAFDARAAGWWLYVCAAGIGAPFDPGPWRVIDGRLTDTVLPGEGTDAHVTLLAASYLAHRSEVPRQELVDFMLSCMAQHGRFWRKSAREPGAAPELADLAIGQLERLHLIVRQGERLLPRPALARFSRPSTSSSPVPRPADADLFSSQD